MGEAKRRAAEITKLKEQTRRQEELSLASAFATLASFAGRTPDESPLFVALQNKLRAYDRNATATAVAALLTVPTLQANCYRLEVLQQLALANCKGTVIPKASDIVGWINSDLAEVAYMEDPPEDVFVMEVVSQAGGFKVLGGLWEIPDSGTNLLINSIETLGRPAQLAWLEPAYQLLRVSDLTLSRAGLQRWDAQLSVAKSRLSDISDADLTLWRNRITFSAEDLNAKGVDPTKLDLFTLTDHDIGSSGDPEEWTMKSFSKPLLKCGENLILAFPTSVTYAVRKSVIERAAASGQLSGLNRAVALTAVQHAERMFRASSRHDVTALPLPAHLSIDRGPFRSFIFRVGRLRVIHIVVLQDPLEQFSVACLREPSQLTESDEAKLDRHIASVRTYIESLGSLDRGYTIALSGHLGQGTALSAPKSRAKWTYEVTRLSFLEFILQTSDAPLDKLILLLTQRHSLELAGVHLPNYNGLLNLYAYWLDNGHTLRIPDMGHDQPGLVQIATNYILRYRIERRQALDIHCEPTSTGKTAVVIRANSDSIYGSVKNAHAYLDISYFTTERQSFCVITRGTAVWITLLTKTSDPHHHKMMHELWEGLQLLLSRTLAQHIPVLTFALPAVEILLDFRSVLPTERALEKGLPSELQVEKGTESTVSIRASQGFLAAFGGSKNTGELLLVSRVIEALRLLSDDTESFWNSVGDSALQILGSSDAKILHAFTAIGPIRHLLSSDPRPTYRLPEEYMDAAIRDAFTWMPSTEEKVVLDQDESCKTLNQAVSHLLNKIAAKLRRFDRRALVVELLHAHETLIRDQQRWAMTARAVMALHGEQEGTTAALKQEQNRSQAKLTLRALVEASVCECSVSGGIPPDGHAIDEVFGLMWALIQLGRDSEAIYHRLSTKGITIFPSGAYSFTADLLAELGGPYTIDSFRANYEAAADDYDQWVSPRLSEKPDDTTDRYESSEFRTAFDTEYSLSFDVFLDICGVLLDAALEAEAVVVDLSRANLIELCQSRGIKEADLDHFLQAFQLSSRPTWAPQPPLAKPQDVQPWRFERRLSVMLRPLIECVSGKEARYVFGAATTQQAISYVLDCTERGKFDKDVFRSSQMRSYIGRRVDALGAEFTKRVATTLQEFGWTIKTEVKMSTLGAGKNPNLGDIDVLAWRGDGRVLAIECKRLKTARSVAEIALTCDRFRGNAGDHLFKHLRRFRWLKDNVDKLAKFVGLDPDLVTIRAPLVTSANVPFRYLQGLDIAADDIWSFSQLQTYCLPQPTNSNPL